MYRFVAISFYFCKAMTYIPDIANYHPFFIQTADDASAIDTTEWGLVAKTNPFPILPNPKAPYRNIWKDEDGDEEYTDEIHYEAFDFEVTFFIKCYKTEKLSADAVMRKQIDEFFAKIRQGSFMIYDSHTGVGRKDVRYDGFSEESYKRQTIADTDWARAIFRVKFKVNDPITRIVMRDGKLVEE